MNYVTQSPDYVVIIENGPVNKVLRFAWKSRNDIWVLEFGSS